MSCKRCQARVKDWEGSDPRCAFEGGSFDSDNWNCATMNELREKAEPHRNYSDDQSAAIVAHDGLFLVLGWYKDRGCTEAAKVLNGDDWLMLTEELAEVFLTGEHRDEP